MTDVHGLIRIVTSAAGGTGCAAAAGVDGVDVAADDAGGTGEAVEGACRPPICDSFLHFG